MLIYEMEDVLEKLIVYRFNPLKIMDIEYPKNKKTAILETPNWVIKEVAAGNDINEVMNYLKQMYKEVHWAFDNFKLGYDIIADHKYFKIKSLDYDNNKFFITNKELYLAFKYKKDYNMFFIKSLETSNIGFIVENFYSILDIEHKKFVDKTTSYSNNNISMVSINYEIVLEDDFVNGLDKIQLMDYDKKLEQEKIN